ncbi:hypothetical protein [Mesonia aquimarina]|uniref:hypothetical protein n=1 Tax=Mesonia aquimarina TaxID=1504967 RepID=UPI0013CF3D15|nr:hypothetical protein [Mesonia aquimarina]
MKYKHLIRLLVKCIFLYLMFSSCKKEYSCLKKIHFERNNKAVGADVLELTFYSTISPAKEKIVGELKFEDHKISFGSYSITKFKENLYQVEYMTSEFIGVPEEKVDKLIQNKKLIVNIENNFFGEVNQVMKCL